MASSKVLKVQRSDATDEFVLLRTLPAGKHELDVDLVATEGSCPFVGKVRHRKLKDLQAASYQGDSTEWETILKYLLDGGDALPQLEATNDLEIIAELSGEDPHQKLTIVIRKRIEKITQRLGSLELEQNDDEEVQLYEWTGQAVQASRDRLAEVADLTAKFASAQETITQLETKLEELVKAKDEQEQLLLSQFAALLNEKKLKIRNQQRVLSTANIDKKTLQGLEQAAEAKGRDAKASSKAKRKAAEPVEESDSSDGFDDIDNGLGAGNDEANSDSEPADTPDDETASDEDEIEMDDQPPPSKKVTSAKPGTKQSQARAAKSVPDPSDGTEKKSGTSLPPPRRDLPFARRKQKSSGRTRSPSPKQTSHAMRSGVEDSATDDDDEL